jgi:hypothetical protein
MTTKTILTDQELIDAFAGVTPGRTYQATLIPLGEKNTVDNWDTRFFKATTKPEAVRIAREYAARIAGKKLVYVYLVPKSGRRW